MARRHEDSRSLDRDVDDGAASDALSLSGGCERFRLRPGLFARIDARPWAALAALTAFAALLRAIGSDSGLWLDEIITLVESVRRPLAQILTAFPGNNQHTLYSVLAPASVR